LQTEEEDEARSLEPAGDHDAALGELEHDGEEPRGRERVIREGENRRSG
jgi:hypothetical protein